MEKDEGEVEEKNGGVEFRSPSGPAGRRHREQRTSSTLPIKIGTEVQPVEKSNN